MEKPNCPYRCTDCRFFAGEKVFEKPCVELGILKTSKSCAKFKPQVKKLKDALVENDGNALMLLAALMTKIPSKSLHVLGSVIHNEKVTRSYGYAFMQRVYVRHNGTSGANFLTNFMPCHIIEASKSGLRLMSASGETFILKLDFEKGEIAGPSVYSINNFKILKAEMIKKGNKIDPATLRKRAVISNLTEDKQDTKPNKKQYVINDLVAMTAELESGRRVSSTYRKPVKQVNQYDGEVFEIGKR